MSMRVTVPRASLCRQASKPPPAARSFGARRVSHALRVAAVVTFAILPGAGRAPAADRRCQAVCSELGARILREPSKFEMAVEDALVAHETCAFEIVRAAIDAVSAEPERVRRIWRAAIAVLPHRRAEIDRATVGFAPPRAVTYREPDPVVKRAELPGRGHRPVVLEVRRAEAPATRAAIEEIRRPEISAPPSVSGATSR